ncbi:MAG: family 78 glycoside hydrolase catalytic domain, partial [Clostridia bacterium]|nr:family 78 glycoside hydrolase catalytic domain [Clostridia bacterium]
DENTLSRLAGDCVSYVEKSITPQIGYSFRYDPNLYDGYISADYTPKGFAPSQVVEGPTEFKKRPIKKLITGEFIKAKKTGESGNIYDLGAEYVGFIKVKYSAPKGKKFSVLYGEHLADGQVRDIIGPRDFSVEFYGTGESVEVSNYFRRLGCRYLEVRDSECVIEEIGVIPVWYPLEEKEFVTENPLAKDIYDISVRTLKLCMHEHYEDCPWREQALYAMDSRNQILCGYYAFGEYEFPRASLELMAQAQKEDKLLPLCFPAGSDVPIPFFSLIYTKEMREYAEYTKDLSLLKNYIGLLRDIVGVFVNKVDEKGGLYDFNHYWNFYEWSDGMDGVYNGKLIRVCDERRQELPLICFTLIAIQDLNACERLIGEEESYGYIVEKMKKSANEIFWSEEKQAYRSFENTEHYSKLCNSLAILAGLAKDGKAVAEKIVTGGFVDTTLSMKAFEYDALLSVDKGYGQYILDEIYRNYSYMLQNGATSFWETILGESDFGNAGSLCHGWSAIPVYYFNLLKVGENKNA